MLSKSIIKLIDEAIIPAVVLIIGKMLGLFVASSLFHLSFTVKNAQIFWILPRVSFTTLSDYIKAENYSNLTMFMVAMLGTLYVIVRAHFFHESHITPKLHAKLVSLNLDRIVAPSYHIYHQAAIWLTFLWLTVIFLAISSFLKITYPQISIMAFIIAANFSWVFAMDIEREIEISKEI
ncbi:hypothetical protein A2870_04530 [Candidatus Curtissbacteria bacterium RIFCSPHIGHO2_01_FULL_41_11]|uniref:Uncharacterized protein n=1 Tax=Candidatus Curtissbacteria bacterium RIFCSPHIGHO2_01_FULL_41_11 TaxID=1797711 RepID=A0A1F5G892_9BACT|nr:MAG: hypothetical protein A2870_04530 [Candidatus Curtissbacteria bacterium RIFCSPHIGHO2_01_FULL_41_11]